MLISIVIRTLNEEKYLSELLEAIQDQHTNGFEVETIIIDSGSDDMTIQIAEKYNCRITHINKKDFTFGRSLNKGSEFSSGDILIYISGHCIPVNKFWITELISPIINKESGYVYGRQIGRDTTKYSETKIFSKYFPETEEYKKDDFFCNNANSAIHRDIWKKYLFDEEITGLEDMELAKRYFIDGGKISYTPSATVYHIHDESWMQTKRRYEREAIALQKILPEVNITFLDMLRYIFISIIEDLKFAIIDGKFIKEFIGIIKFRIAQYTGTYRGNHEQRALSKKRKENYFYPKRR